MEKLVKYYGRKGKLSRAHKSEVEYPYSAIVPKQEKTHRKRKGLLKITDR